MSGDGAGGMVDVGEKAEAVGEREGPVESVVSAEVLRVCALLSKRVVAGLDIAEGRTPSSCSEGRTNGSI